MSFQSKAFLIVFLMTCGSVLFLFWAASRTLNEERLARFSTVASERTLSMSAGVELELRRLSDRPDHELVTARSPALLKHYSLPRWPAQDEYLVGFSGERPLIFGRKEDGSVWFNELSRIDPPWHKADVVLYWFTASGTLLGANSKSILKNSFSERKLFQLYRASNGGWGGEHFKSAGGPIFASFHEVPNTNVVVAAEFPTASKSGTQKNFYIASIILTVVVTILVYLYSKLNSFEVMQLSGRAAAVIHQFCSGSFSVNSRLPLYLENSKLLDALNELGWVLQAREKEFSHFSAGVRHLLIGCQNITRSQDSFEICAHAAHLLLKHLSFATTGNAWVYLSLPNESGMQLTEPPTQKHFIQGQLLGRGDIQPSQWSVGPCQKISDPSQVLVAGELLFEPSTRLVVIPLMQEQRAAGFLVLEGYKLDLIPDFEACVMVTVARIASPLILAHAQHSHPGSRPNESVL